MRRVALRRGSVGTYARIQGNCVSLTSGNHDRTILSSIVDCPKNRTGLRIADRGLANETESSACAASTGRNATILTGPIHLTISNDLHCRTGDASHDRRGANGIFDVQATI